MAKAKSERNWFGRHKILTGLGIFIVLIIVVSATGGHKSNTASTSAKSTGTESKTKTAAAIKIGQAADDGKFEFTVASIKCGEPNVADSTGYLTKTAQGQYCLLNISVKNIGNEAQTLDSTSQYLYNASGQQYKSDSTATIYTNPSNGTFLNSINPGNTVNGTVVFDIPQGQTPVSAELHDSAFSGGVKVNLQ